MISYRLDQGEQEGTQREGRTRGKTKTRSGREVKPTERLGVAGQVQLSPRDRKRRMTAAKRAQKEGRK